MSQHINESLHKVVEYLFADEKKAYESCDDTGKINHIFPDLLVLKSHLDKQKKCDGCGRYINGKSFPMFDENFNKQKGLQQCASCCVNIKNN